MAVKNSGPAVFCGFWLKCPSYSGELFSLRLSCMLLQIKRQIASLTSSACESAACPIQLFPKGSFMKETVMSLTQPSPDLGWSQNKLNQ